MKSFPHSQPKMATFRALYAPSLAVSSPHHKTHFLNPHSTSFSLQTTPRSNLSTAISSPTPVEPDKSQDERVKFDWYSQWYPVMPVCDLDKRVPHAKTVVGLEVVVWWDRNESAWKVFEDACPHRLAPLSEGRIDQWGRLQCVYHGWCFSGSGDCKFIPQATPDGPPVHTFKKACVAAYPSVVQNGVVWFWPNSKPEYKDILSVKKPPFIPELDDPSFVKPFANRDMPFGYEVLLENLMDPAHVPYAHFKILGPPLGKSDREGGLPINIDIQRLGIHGFEANRDGGASYFMAPCIYFFRFTLPNKRADQGNGSLSSGANSKQSSRVSERKVLLVFMCVPVSPGKSRLIFTFPRNFATWIDQIVPRWVFHLSQNLVLDSDMYLLHIEERKIMEVGPSNWQKACFVPTKSDGHVVAFRKWLKKYSGGQFNWADKFTGELPPTPPKEQLMDRYRSHVLNCRSCNAAHKGLSALEVVLQVLSIVSIGTLAGTKQGVLSAATRTSLVLVAVICFATSRWLAYFIYKNFHFHDYNHALL